jgi:chromosome segregation ATPase
MMEIDENQSLESQIEKSRLSNQAMEIRLSLKNEEISALKAQIQAKQEMLSLQYHAINQMEKPLLVDQSVLNHINEMKSLLESKKKELDDQTTENASYNGKPFAKGSKLQNAWLKSGEDAYNGIKDFAEGPVQDLVLQIQLADLKIQELEVRLKESKEIYEGLEKEAQEQQVIVNDYQGRHKSALEQLELLTQENFKLKRLG